MNDTLILVRLDTDYCNYLRKYDNKVPYNFDKKELRPFVGVLFEVNDCMYFAPLSSPKPKHLKIKSKLDFLKLDNGKLGAINFNNMIPVSENNYNIIYFDKKALSEKDKKYEQLLRDQLNWLNENYIQVKNKSSKIYNLYINDKLSDNIKSHCCNYPLLEEKCMEYNKMVIVS